MSRRWELGDRERRLMAELADPIRGLVEHEFELNHWSVPAEVVEYEEGRMHIVAGENPERADRTRLLRQFVGLAEATDARVAAFVRRFGALELCAAHSFPATHGQDTGASWCEPEEFTPRSFIE